MEIIKRECALLERCKFLLSMRLKKIDVCCQLCISNNEIKCCHFTNFDFILQKRMEIFSSEELIGCQTIECAI
jgi:hypothetical protein